MKPYAAVFFAAILIASAFWLSHDAAPGRAAPGPVGTVTATPNGTPVCGSGAWEQKGQYPIAVQQAGGATLGGQMYIFGGHTFAFVTLADAYRYDPAVNTWTALAPLPAPRAGASVVSDGTYLYILNGADDTGVYQDTFWRYDPATDTYTTLATPPLGTAYQAAVYLDGQVYRIAGCGLNCGTVVTSVDRYSIASDAWAPAGTVAPYPQGVADLAVVAAGGDIWAAGGYGDAPSSGAYRYDPATNTWDDAAVPDLAVQRWSASSAVLDGRWIIAGGLIGPEPPTVDGSVIALDLSAPGAGWVSLPAMPAPRYTAVGASLGGAFYATGGLDYDQPTQDTQQYVETPCPTATPTATATATAPPQPSPTATRPVASPTVTPCALSFSDVHPADYFYAPVQYLACRGAISGYADGTFRPYSNATRAQMVKVVVLGFGLPLTTPPAGGHTFADLAPGFPFFTFVETAAARHIVGGYACGGPGQPCDGQNRPYFHPNANVTRGQLAKIAVAAAGWPLLNPATGTFADLPPGSAFYPFAETAVCHGIISGYSCGGAGEPCDPANRPYFRQYNPATRGQIAKIVYGALTGAACIAR